MKTRAALLIAVLFTSAGVHLFAEADRIPDNNQIRRALSNVIFAPTSEVLSIPPAVYPNPSQGSSVRFDVMHQNGDYYLLFTNEESRSFPIDSAGSYIIKRKDQNGDFVQVKIFLKDGPGSFVRVFPMGDRTSMNLFLYGFPMYHDIVIPVPFKQILTDPFSRIIELTRASVDWSLIFPERPLPEDRLIEGMVTTIRSRLPLLADHNDGAMNAEGRYVSIQNGQVLTAGGLNCSGFAKWVIDGLYEPQTGKLTSIESLKAKHMALRGNRWSAPLEAQRDPYFGLDWARNLAQAIARLSDPSAGATSSDVTNVPFFNYVTNVGYPIADLKFVLYELAVANPGYFYIGSISREYGSDPVLREYTHVVVLFPYFSESGRFEISVMERNLETGLDSLKARFPGDFVQLEQVAASSDFSPPTPRTALTR